MNEKFTWLDAFRALDEIETETVILKEGFKANIADSDEMKKAEEVLDTKEEEPIATVIDPSTTVADDLKDPNPGDVIFCCPDCKTFFYHTSDEVNKSDKVFTGEDGEEQAYYNVGLACPHCGQTEDGFKLVGQVAAFSDKKEEPAKEAQPEDDVADWDSLLKTEEQPAEEAPVEEQPAAEEVPAEENKNTFLESTEEQDDETVEEEPKSDEFIDVVLNKVQVEKLLEVLDYGLWISEMGFDDYEEKFWEDARNSKWVLTNNLNTELADIEPEDGTYCEEGMVLVFNEGALFDAIERSQAEEVLEAVDQDNSGEETFLEALDKTHWTVAKDGSLWIEANLPAKLGVVAEDDVSFVTVTKRELEADTAEGGDMEANLNGFDLRDENWAVFEQTDPRYQELLNRVQANETPADPEEIPDPEEPAEVPEVEVEITDEARCESVREAMDILCKASIKQAAAVINQIVDKRNSMEGDSTQDMPWILPMSQFRYFYENILPEWTEEHPEWGDNQEQMRNEYEEYSGKKFDINEIIEENECFETTSSPMFYNKKDGDIDQLDIFDRAFSTLATDQDELDDIIIEEVNAFVRNPENYNIDNETFWVKGDDAVAANPDVYLESFNEASFEELVNKYLNKTYANIDSFKTTQGILDESRLTIDGTITFKSGKTQDSRFVFERCNKKSDVIKFNGLNETFTRARKPFTLIAEAKDNELVFKQLNYNYVVSESLIAKDSVKTTDFLVESNKRKANKKSK